MQRFLAVAASVFIFVILSRVNFFNINTHGTVQNLDSKDPISGAKVGLGSNSN
jgi:hypothetical protein